MAEEPDWNWKKKKPSEMTEQEIEEELGVGEVKGIRKHLLKETISNKLKQ